MAKIRFDSKVPAIEQSYIVYLLEQGKTILQICAMLECPRSYVQQLADHRPKEIKPLQPPPDYRSVIQARYNDPDIEAAGTAKWLLKQGMTPENVAVLVKKKPAWIYSLISGKIHSFVKAREPSDVREVKVFRTVVSTKKRGPSPEAKAKRETRYLEACYILHLHHRYTTTQLSEITGMTAFKIRSIIVGTTCPSAEEKEMPEGYWKLPTKIAEIA